MAEPIRNLKTSIKPATSSFDHEPSENFSSELDTLRSEISTLREMLAEKTGVAYDKVAEKTGVAYDMVAESASNAANYVSSEANSVAGTIREHPAASTTLFTLIGGIGFALGYLVATASADSKQAWYQRYINDRF